MAETILWIDPDGVSTTLHTGSLDALFVSWNVHGRFAPPARFTEDGVPEQDGLQLREVLHDAREFSLPFWVRGASESDLWTKQRALVVSMDPKRGEGVLRITTPVGDQREISCRVVSGLEGAERIGDTTGQLAQSFPAVFRAWNPYWRSVSDNITDYTPGSATGSFFPLFPLRLTSSEVFADATIVNDGDVDAWPVWTINGTGSGIVLSNLTTGKSLSLSTFLGVGESLTVDTRPRVKTVTKQDGTNLWTDVSATSTLWPLVKGTNAIRIQMGAATATSRVRLARRNQYLTV